MKADKAFANMIAARVACNEDAEDVVRILVQSITKLCVADHQNDAATLQEWLANKTVIQFLELLASTENFCVVAEFERRVAGVGLINRRGEVELCYVGPEDQHRGCGTAILRALETQARAWGLEKVHLASTVSARTFYERSGYSVAGHAKPGFGSSWCYPYEKVVASWCPAQT